jgi:hypothetical protein
MFLIRPLATPFVKSALVTLAMTLLLGRSSYLGAAGEKETTLGVAQAAAEASSAPTPAQLKPGESRVDALEVNATLVPSPTHPSRLAVELVVKNPTDREIVTRCDLTLERYSGDAEARVGPPPSTVWRHNEELELLAGATTTRHIELPQRLSALVQRTRDAAARGVMPRKFVAYEVSAFPTDPRVPAGSTRANRGWPRAAQAALL